MRAAGFKGGTVEKLTDLGLQPWEIDRLDDHARLHDLDLKTFVRYTLHNRAIQPREVSNQDQEPS